MRQDDIYVESMLNLLNLRFGPANHTTEAPDPEQFGGIHEMAALQKEFEVFKPGRSFSQSVRVMGLGGYMNARARNRWLKYLDGLGASDQTIVKAIVDNLAAAAPKPIHFTRHDMAGGGEATQARIVPSARAVFYLPHDFIVISLPMKQGSNPLP